MARSVVVFVPGLTGSRLERQGEVVWPGKTLQAILTRYDRMEALLAEDLQPVDIIRKVGPFGIYQPLLDDLQSWGFSETSGNLRLFAYDWRRDNLESASALAGALDGACDTLGPDLDITLVAHSMGGLVSRCYLESGAYRSRPAFRCVRRLITLGTPHLGAPLALLSLLGQERAAFLQKDQVALLGADPRFPSAYQLLPPDSEPFAWKDHHEHGAEALEPAHLDQTDLGLTPQGLAKARAFRDTLSLDRRPDHVRYFFFVGTTQKTATSVRLTRLGLVERVEADAAGDGTVPTWSAGLAGIQQLTVGGSHARLFRAGEARRTLAALLGVSRLRAPQRLPDVELALRSSVLGPEELLHLTLDSAPGVRLQGRLVIEAEAGPTSPELSSSASATRRPIGDGALWRPVTELPVVATSPSVRSLALALPAPRERGAYRIAYYDEGARDPLATDDLIVQD